jgi:uncharacterized protein (DUF433 family)
MTTIEERRQHLIEKVAEDLRRAVYDFERRRMLDDGVLGEVCHLDPRPAAIVEVISRVIEQVAGESDPERRTQVLLDGARRIDECAARAAEARDGMGARELWLRLGLRAFPLFGWVPRSFVPGRYCDEVVRMVDRILESFPDTRIIRIAEEAGHIAMSFEPGHSWDEEAIEAIIEEHSANLQAKGLPPIEIDDCWREPRMARPLAVDPASHPRVHRDPAVLLGKPRIRGTRLSVELILTDLGAGWPFEEMLASYPALRREDILAVLNYAADVVHAVWRRERP